MKLRTILAAATCLGLPMATAGIAHAQPVTGPYVDAAGGITFINYEHAHYDIPGEPAPNRLNLDFSFKPDYAADAGIGYGFGDGFRVELDGDYMHNTLHHLKISAGGESESGRVSGHENKYGPMVNVLYDFDFGLPVYPYIGAGAGYQFVNEKLEGLTFKTKGTFAYDVIAGLSYPLAMVPGLSLTAQYTFMQLVGDRTESFGGSDFDEQYKYGSEISSTALLGLRYELCPPPMMAPAPAAAPMAAPAPAPAKTYLVFFDWDKYFLTPKATTIIAEAASDSKTTGVTTLDVSGYTDTSGTPDYNQGLSERRAKAVAAKLVSDGVPASEIEIHAYGETHLLVPTGPGVREPQNRRVEIVLQ